MQISDTLTSSVAAALPGTRRLRFTPLLAALGVCVCLAGQCAHGRPGTPARASSGALHSASAAGTHVSVDTRWVDGAGYRPVKVTLTPTTTTLTDKTFTIEFLLRRRHWPEDQYDLRVARDIELPAGSAAVRETVAVPRYPDCDSYKINVLEDGQLLLALCPNWTPYANMPTDWGECLPAILIVADAMPDTSQMAALLPLENYAVSQTDRRLNRTPFRARSFVKWPNVPQQLPNVVVSGPAWARNGELPQRWIDYSSLDVVCLSLEKLDQTASKNPAALKAILRWTAAGGNLWVYGMGQDWRRLEELEDLLGLSPGIGHAGDPVGRGWTLPGKEVYLERVQGALTRADTAELRYMQTIPGAFDDGDESAFVSGQIYRSVLQPPIGEAPSEPHFLLRPYDLGLLVALAPDDPFPGTTDRWRGVLNAVGPDRWLWYRRHGMSMVCENADYWNFLIPGVGLVPVFEFCLLITLFVLAIGPANYWLLQRCGRLHLLVVTIPLGAATVTMILFAYALVADGLGTRVRVRSVTWLDQSREQAACWARLSYYAGLAPRRGLKFPDDVAVLPLEHLPVPDRREGPLRRGLIWEHGPPAPSLPRHPNLPRRTVQRFVSGWLDSRTPMQLLTVRSRRSRLGLELIRTGGTLRVKNRLGTRIEQLVVYGEDRKYYWAQGVDVEKTTLLQPFTPRAQAKFRKTWLESQPQVSPGIQTRYNNYSDVFGLRNIRRPRGGSSAIIPPTQQTSRLEASLAGLSTLGSVPFSPLRPGSYVAVVKQSPEVVLGVASASEEASFHVILGKW